MKLIRIVLSFVMYVCIYLFFFLMTILTLAHPAAKEHMSQSSALVAVLFPLVFPLVIWYARKNLREKLANTQGFLEKVEVYGPLIRLLIGYELGYFAGFFLIDWWPDIKKEYPWTVWLLWEGSSFLLGYIWAKSVSMGGSSYGLGLTFPWNKKKESEQSKNLKAIRHLSSLAERSDHPFDLMEARLPYPERLKSEDLSPLYKSMTKRSIELNEVPPEDAQNLFKNTLGIVCSPGEKFLFVFKNYALSISENKSDISGQSIGFGLPGPMGIGFGTGTSRYSSKDVLRTNNYGSGLVALTTKNLYFQRNDIWQKVERSRIVSCKNDCGEIDITFSDQSGQSKLVRINFFDYQISSMLETLLRRS